MSHKQIKIAGKQTSRNEQRSNIEFQQLSGNDSTLMNSENFDDNFQASQKLPSKFLDLKLNKLIK